MASSYGGLQDNKLTFWLFLSTASVVIGQSSQFGYGMGVMTGPSEYMQDFYNQSNYERRGEYLSENAVMWLWSFTVSLYCLGAAVGSLIAGYFSEKIGRKKTILLNNIASIVPAVMFGISKLTNTYEIILVGRFIYGVHVGTVTVVVPLYLAEISPTNLRGAIATCHQLMVTIGILLGQVFGFYILPGEDDWPIVLAITAVFSGFNLITMPFCPESPRWLLITKNKPKESRSILHRLRNTRDVEDEMQDMENEALKAAAGGDDNVSVWDIITLKDRDWKIPLLISIAAHVGQQTSGINAIFFYLSEIYKQAGLAPDEVAIATVGTGCVNVGMTIVSLMVIERIGRRKLLLYPFAFMAIFHGLLTVSINLQDKNDWIKWLSMVFIYLYIVSFAIGPGPMPFVLVPELWAQAPRPAAMGIAVQMNWISNFIIGITFIFMQTSMGAYTFLVFMVCCIISDVIFFIFVPETKGRTFEDIVAGFKGNKRGKGYELAPMK